MHTSFYALQVSPHIYKLNFSIICKIEKPPWKNAYQENNEYFWLMLAMIDTLWPNSYKESGWSF